MIEEIINESEIVLFDGVFGESNCEFEYEEEVIRLKYLFKILNNQPDYKSAWEEFIDFINTTEQIESGDICTSNYIAYSKLLIQKEELEQKYNLGGE